MSAYFVKFDGPYELNKTSSLLAKHTHTFQNHGRLLRLRIRWHAPRGTRHANRDLKCISLIVPLHFNFISWWQERIETHDQIGKPLEQTGNTLYHARSVDRLTLELFHDVQKVVVNLGLVAKLELDEIQVGEGVLHFQPLEAVAGRLLLLLRVLGRGNGRGRPLGAHGGVPGNGEGLHGLGFARMGCGGGRHDRVTHWGRRRVQARLHAFTHHLQGASARIRNCRRRV